jgi:hypothetical protein
MYLSEPRPLLDTLAKLASPKGVISILTLNTHSLAMREGLLGHWQDAKALIEDPFFSASHYLRSERHDEDELIAYFARNERKLLTWYGVLVFTDHRSEDFGPDDLGYICDLEWIAGTTDPYRQVARLRHLLLQ